MNILGISFGYHDSSASLLRDGHIVACAQEERFIREKNTAKFPIHAINFCLQQANITINEIDYITYYEKPYYKFHRYLISHLLNWPFSLSHFLQKTPYWLSQNLTIDLQIRDTLGFEKEIHFIPHHLSHAASSFFVSPFEKAIVLVADGVGEWATLSWGIGNKNEIKMQQEIRLPHSIGLLYSAITHFLGFEVNGGEGKVMGLADWGKPIYKDEFSQLISRKEDGSFAINQKYLHFWGGRQMYHSRLEKLLGPARLRGEKLLQRHKDIAATLQSVTEEILVNIARRLQQQTGITKICLAGGSFLNIPTNSSILKDGGFEDSFVQPAAGDAGGSLGSALYFYHQLQNNPRVCSLEHVNYGAEYENRKIEIILQKNRLQYSFFNDDELCEHVATFLQNNKIVGWVQGRQEFGPRALGKRSILAAAEQSDMKDVLNTKVKHREAFRPYGISIIEECLDEVFDAPFTKSPFMLKVANVKDEFKYKIPAALHINNTSRIQTVNSADKLYYKLLQTYYRKSGIPLFINTSFNDNTEPIVLTPQDAVNCFVKTRMDILVIGNYVVTKD